jgi:hypothetical protein
VTREFVLKFLGDTTGLNRALDESAGRMDRWGGRMTAVAGASVAAGGALEALARSQADNSRSVERLTELTGLQSDAVRTLAADLASVDSPLEEVLAVMEHGTKVGAEGADGLRQYAEFWDLVGDATGEEATTLAELSSTLQSVGIDVNNLAEAQDALGFAQANTTDGALGFLELLEKRAPAIREMGLDINDTAAILAAMERELGITGRTARTEFEQAINSSEGSMETMLETLGLSQEQFETYRGQVEGSADVLDRLAEANTGNFTPLERLQAKVGELTFTFGDQIQAAANLAPLLLALGPAMKAGQVASGLLSGGLKAALLPLIAPPAGLILLGLAAVVAAGVLVWKNWDTIKEKAGQLWGFVKDVFGKITDWFGNIFAKAMESNVLKIVGLFTPAGPFIILWHFKDDIMSILGSVGDFIGGVFDTIIGAAGRVVGAIQAIIDTFQNLPSAGDVASHVPGSGSGAANILGTVGQGILDANLGARAVNWFGDRFDSGGVVPGPRGRARLVMAHGGETILPTHRTGGGMAGEIHLHFNAPLGATSAEMQRIVRRALTDAGIRGIGV